jgi:hypothetical protein
MNAVYEILIFIDDMYFLIDSSLKKIPTFENDEFKYVQSRPSKSER